MESIRRLANGFEMTKRKTKAELSAERRTLARNIALYEQSKEKEPEMTDSINAKIRAKHPSGFGVEIDMINTAADSIDEMCKALLAKGYTMTSSGSSNYPEKPDYAGKRAKVKSVTQIPGKNQWKVDCDIEGGGSVEFIAFAATTHRVGDILILGRNEKGYYYGTLESLIPPAGTQPMPF